MIDLTKYTKFKLTAALKMLREKRGINESGPENGSAGAFKGDLMAKLDESKGILLPIHGILLFSKQNEHQRMDFGSQKGGNGETPLDVPSVFPMKN